MYSLYTISHARIGQQIRPTQLSSNEFGPRLQVITQLEQILPGGYLGQVLLGMCR